MVMGFFLDKCGVFFVRWFREPFFEQVVFALGVLVIPSASDGLPVVNRYSRLFDEVFEAIELAMPRSSCHEEDLYCISYVSFFDEIFHDLYVTTACCLSCHFFFRLSRRFHFGEKKPKTVEVSFNSSMFTRLFFIIRAIVREAVL